ncbi:hypothetical protein T12_5461 [Trichinella patagoniensis]|uniref:Uncharacterized protein n=1 Tax=Trichinella patagoniensis TaxID=990121 RepID=A0A0V1AFR6_9BILA|nr:hypothetical protein T12_5461 [Trichinella patagoniensis]
MDDRRSIEPKITKMPQLFIFVKTELTNLKLTRHVRTATYQCRLEKELCNCAWKWREKHSRAAVGKNSNPRTQKPLCSNYGSISPTRTSSRCVLDALRISRWYRFPHHFNTSRPRHNVVTCA